MPDNDIAISLEDLPILDSVLEPDLLLPTPELKIKGIKDQREAVEVVVASERTFLILVAVHKDKSRNVISRISCKMGLAIGGYLHDTTTDNYVIDCSEYLHLGFIPVSMIIRVSGVANWGMRIPLSDAVIRRFLTSRQKKEIRNFKAHYRSDEYILQFMQLVDAN